MDRASSPTASLAVRCGDRKRSARTPQDGASETSPNDEGIANGRDGVLAVRQGGRNGSLSCSCEPRDGIRAGGAFGYHPFMPVRVTPWMKYFWAKKNTAITGSVISNEPAIIIP
jgi:hypothetical protein